MILVFSTVCCIQGEWLCINHESIKSSVDASTQGNQEVYRWLSTSIVVLTKLSFFLHGQFYGDVQDKGGISIEAAAQIMFTRLLRMVLQSTGYLTSTSSIYLAHALSLEDSFRTVPSLDIMKQEYGSIVDEKISSILDLTINELVYENFLINRLAVIIMVIDAWVYRLIPAGFNDTSVAKMESQAMIILRQLANEMFHLRQTVSKDLILVGQCVEKLAVSIHAWSEKKRSEKVNMDSMETVHNLLVICLQTITVDEDTKLIFSDSIRKLRSLVEEKQDVKKSVIVADDQYETSFDISSLNESSFDLRLSKYCTITLTDNYTGGVRKKASSSGNKATEMDVITDIIKASYDEGYIFEIYRQVIIDRCLFSLTIAPCLSSFEGPSRPWDSFQVAYPLVISQQYDDDLILWPGSVVTVSGSSDPVHVICSYAPEKSMKDDSTTYWALKVLLTICNNTSVSIPSGIQVVIKVVSSHYNSLNDDLRNNYFTEAIQQHPQEIKAGDTLIFSAIFDSLPFGINTLIPRILFPGIKTETPLQDYWNEDELQPILDENDGYEYLDLMLPCSTVTTSIFLSLRPNPLVFFRNATGDESSFNFLWSSCTYTTMLDMSISSPSSYHLGEEENIHGFRRNAPDTLVRCSKVLLRIDKEKITLHAWAFRTWCGSHLLIKYHYLKDDHDRLQLELRSDNPTIIHTLISDDDAKRELIHTLSLHLAVH